VSATIQNLSRRYLEPTVLVRPFVQMADWMRQPITTGPVKPFKNVTLAMVVETFVM
jgi:hypothetical protein